MPSQASRQTIARRWELLRCLPSAGAGETAAALCQRLSGAGFSVSKRQVERDLRDLAAIFPLECNDAGTPFGWRWAGGAQLQMPGMDVSQALSLHLVASAVRPLLPASLLQVMTPRFAEAERKLAELGANNPLCRWQDKVRSVPAQRALLAPQVDEAVLLAVHQALMADEQLDIRYRGLDAEVPSDIRLHPLALVQRGPVSYLLATAWDYEDVRLYALHRMHQVTRSYEAARRPVGFQVDDWLVPGQTAASLRAPLRLRARVSPTLARILAETPLADGQSMTEGIVDATVDDDWDLRWWILSQGDGIEVLEPIGLRQEIATLLHRACAAYTEPHSTSDELHDTP